MASTAQDPQTGGASTHLPGAGIPRRLVTLLAVTCGVAVANLYYAQPLLHTLAHAFSVSESTSGLLVTAGQVGYVLGLAFIVPLGDLLERRRLILTSICLTAIGEVACAVAPGFGVFAAATVVVGVSTVAAQVIIPMASSLARPQQRGQVVGTIMSGLLMGILVARTFSGLIASALGWRWVFWIGAGLLAVLALTLARALPKVRATTDLRYRAALRSVLSFVASEPVLRQRMLLAALGFGTFSTLWTSLSFQLSAAPFHYSNAVIGLFGLAGVAGATAASVVGRLIDRGFARLTTPALLVILPVSWAILYLGRHSAIGLIVGIAVLDLGVQGMNISNQHAIYALNPDARSRINTAYMVANFAGGAVLSAVCASVYSADGWGGVCILGAITAVLMGLVWAATARAGAGVRPAPDR